jgi:hypothetical protein
LNQRRPSSKDINMKSSIRPISISLILMMAGTAVADDPAGASRYERRWVYSMTNLQVEANADRLIALIGRAADAGYNGVVLADYKLNILDRVPDHYFRNVERVKRAAAEHGVELIPAIFPIGYSNGLLAHDPNLAEGLPAESLFVARDGVLTLVRDPEATLVNGGLEQVRDHRFHAFSQDDPGAATVADEVVKHGGQVSCRMRDTDRTSRSAGNTRLIQRVKVRPHACYRLSAWVKSQDLQHPGNFKLLAIGAGDGGRSLTFFEGGVARTQDWKRLDVVFNTLDYSEVNVYAGIWGGSPGTLWIDDLALEELALVNVLRRPGCPFEVISEDGQTRYEEGRDFEPVADPKLGQVPYAGEYDFDHEGPAIRLRPGGRIRDGQRLRVRWYHPVLVHGSQIMGCLSEPKVYDVLRDQARRVEALFHPKTYFLSHDEIRVANWCRACRERGLTPGELLADNVRRCAAIVGEISPGAETVVWSDMFDPHHNAVDDYYLVNGTLRGSWEGLPRAMIVANWNSGHAAESLRFFAGRGHRQIIAGYYDADDLGGFTRWDEAARGVDGILGFMYTTWREKFGLLEDYGRALRGEAR